MRPLIKLGLIICLLKNKQIKYSIERGLGPVFYYLFAEKRLRIRDEEVNQSVNPLITVINPNKENALNTVVLKLSLPS